MNKKDIVKMSDELRVGAVQAQIPTPVVAARLNLLPCTVCGGIKTWGIISSRACVDCLVSSASNPEKYKMLVTALNNRNVIINSIVGGS